MIKTIAAKETKKLLDKNEAILIDVRETVEYNDESIKLAYLIPLGELSADKLPTFKKTIIIHCKSGYRSANACTILLAEDPSLEVYSLEGGIIAWKEAGFKTSQSENKLITKMKKPESEKKFIDDFSKILILNSSKNLENKTILKASYINTPLGTMVAISDDEKLYLLDFADRNNLVARIQNLFVKTKYNISLADSTPILSIKKELDSYFSSKLKKFETPVKSIGTEFQKKSWNALLSVPYGETRSYLNQAEYIQNKKAFRAVANANGANNLLIIVPCHRIINNNGATGGYGGGIWRKEWLLKHEAQNS